MVEFIVSKEELIEMFNKEDIIDSNDGWTYKDTYYINIVALHEQEPKYVYDVTNAQYYKIIAIKNI